MKWLSAMVLVALFAGCTESPIETQEAPSSIVATAPTFGPAAWNPLPCDLGGATHYGLNAVPAAAWRMEAMDLLAWYADQVHMHIPSDLSFESALQLVTDEGNLTFAPHHLSYTGAHDALKMQADGNDTNWQPMHSLLTRAGVTRDVTFSSTIEQVGNSTTFTLTQMYQNHTLYIDNAPIQVSWTNANNTEFTLHLSQMQHTFYGLSLMPAGDAAELAQSSAECISVQQVAGRPQLNVTQLQPMDGLHVVYDSLAYGFTMQYDNGLACTEGVHSADIYVDAFTGAILANSVTKTTCEAS